MAIERLSIELTNRCNKACSFCYNHSLPGGETHWSIEEAEGLVRDGADRSLRAVSFGGGEPLQFEGLYELLERLRGVLFRSLTSNGLLLDEGRMGRLVAAAPDKIHLSIHFPENEPEVTRVIGQVKDLEARGLRSGINLLVPRSKLEAARAASERIQAADIGLERVMFLPMRISDTPTPQEIARVAGSDKFQSMSCLMGCGRSPRFCSLGWDKRVGWCSYTKSKAQLERPTFSALEQALEGLPLEFCGGTP